MKRLAIVSGIIISLIFIVVEEYLRYASVHSSNPFVIVIIGLVIIWGILLWVIDPLVECSKAVFGRK